MLMNKCRTYDEDSSAISTHYESVNERNLVIRIVVSFMQPQVPKEIISLHLRIANVMVFEWE